jgi:AbrB family looped-hinge helix DNA binding protein
MPTTESQVEYMAHTRIGEKGQLTIPKQYRDEFGLEPGAPVAVLRIGEALMLIPEQSRFQTLCESIASVLERRELGASDVLDSLPAARQRVFARRYPELAGRDPGGNRRSKRR